MPISTVKASEDKEFRSINHYDTPPNESGDRSQELQTGQKPTPEQEGNFDEVFGELQSRFELCAAADGENVVEAMSDLRFLKGDQWPEKQRRQREADGRPVLTINRLPTFLAQVTNDQRQNRASIKVSPVGVNQDPMTAEVVRGMVRHIEYASSADAAYDTAVNSAAAIGFGYWRLVTEYENELSFNQELRIKRIRNPFTVYGDPGSVEVDGSDSEFWIISEKMSKGKFKADYPSATVTLAGFDSRRAGEGDLTWISSDFVRVAEYYRIEREPVTICLLSDGSVIKKGDPIPEPQPQQPDPTQAQGQPGQTPPGQQTPVATAAQPPQPPQAAPAPLTVVQERQTYIKKIMWYKMTPCEILESTEIKCKWIPVFPVYGTEIDIDGKVYRSGMVRNAKDPATMYNFWMTSATEEVAMRPKVPYIGAKGQFEGYEKRWASANSRSYSYLEYNPVEINGQLAPPPARQSMIDVPVGVLAMANHAADNIKATTGLFDSSLGASGNAQSGKQEIAQQRQGSTANAHYFDNFQKTLRQCGRCVMDMIPHYYDTKRLILVRGDDGKAKSVYINDWNEAAQKVMNDIRVGQWDIAVTTGPSYATMRAEAADSMIQTAKNWPKLMDVAGDKVISAMDWPGSEEIAERVKRTIPPEIVGPEDGQQAVPPQAQQEIAQLKQQVQTLTQEADKNKTKLEAVKMETASREKIAGTQAASASDVAELKGVIALLVKKLDPPPALAQDVAQDIATNNQLRQAPQQPPAPSAQPPQSDPGAAAQSVPSGPGPMNGGEGGMVQVPSEA